MNTLSQQNKAHFHIFLDSKKVKGKVKKKIEFPHWADFREVYILMEKKKM